MLYLNLRAPVDCFFVTLFRKNDCHWLITEHAFVNFFAKMYAMLLGLIKFIARFDKRVPTDLPIDRISTSVLFKILILSFLIFSAELLVLSLKIVLTMKLHSML